MCLCCCARGVRDWICVASLDGLHVTMDADGWSKISFKGIFCNKKHAGQTSNTFSKDSVIMMVVQIGLYKNDVLRNPLGYQLSVVF